MGRRVKVFEGEGDGLALAVLEDRFEISVAFYGGGSLLDVED